MKHHTKLRVAVVLVLVFTAVLAIQTASMAQTIPEPGGYEPGSGPETPSGGCGILKWFWGIILFILMWFHAHFGC